MTETQQAENTENVRITTPVAPDLQTIMSGEALSFLAELHQRFNPARENLLEKRADRQTELDAGKTFDFLEETAEIREGDWRVAEVPADLQKRWVEITGPTTRKMMINALNSGSNGFMANFEDSLAPTWENVVRGQKNLIDAVRRWISFENSDGRKYELMTKRQRCSCVRSAGI